MLKTLAQIGYIILAGQILIVYRSKQIHVMILLSVHVFMSNYASQYVNEFFISGEPVIQDYFSII